MSRITPIFTPAGRDAGLRRLRVVNRVLIGATVAVTGLLTDVAAHAFPGHRRVVTPRATGAATPATQTGHHARSAAAAHHRRHGPAHHALRPPRQAPTTATVARPRTTSAPPQTTQASPQTTPAPPQTTPAPQAAAPAPQPAPSPAPVVSGGS
jgi:hypothetical protein